MGEISQTEQLFKHAIAQTRPTEHQVAITNTIIECNEIWLTLGDRAVPAPESAAALSKAAAEFSDVVPVRDVHAQRDGEEEREEHRDEVDELSHAGGYSDNEADDAQDNIRPDGALKGGKTDLLSD